MSPSALRQRNQRRGIRAEYFAAAYLTLKGYRLLALRYKTKYGEIDLVMRRGNALVFVEVKARATHHAAAFAVHQKNQSRVASAAHVFLMRNPNYTSLQVRFDVVLVAWYKRPRHLAHAFVAVM